MALDAATEIIAHFAGLFEVAIEGDRIRIEFDPFKLDHPPAELAPLESGPPIDLEAPYQLAKISGSVRYEPERVTLDETFAFEAEPLGQSIAAPTAPMTSSPFEAFIETSASGAGGAVITNLIQTGPVFPQLIPPSLATVTLQQNHLSDNDLILSNGGVVFAPLASFEEDMAAAELFAASLSTAVLGDVMASPAPTSAFAASVVEQLNLAASPDLDGLNATMLRHAEAEGVHVDGAVADELPDWLDSLPDALRDDEETQQDGSGEDTDDGAGPEDEAEAGSSQAGVAVAGEPLSSEVALAAADADEPADDEDEPAAAPDKDPFTGTPAEGDDDSPFDVDPGHAIVTGANQAINVAAISYGWLDGKVIAVAGDVVDVDVVSQQNVLIDRDTTSDGPATATAAAGELPAGDLGADEAGASKAINAAQISKEAASADDARSADDDQFPSFAAVTRIEGDVSLFNHIKQHNYITDMDRAEVELTASNSFFGTGENIAFNQALMTEIGLRFDMITVGGDMLKVDIVDQVNVLLDNDVANLGDMQAAQASLSDNLLMNRAVVESKSLDTYSAMQDSYAQAMQDLEDGLDTLSDEIMQDRLFAGDDLLTALHIEGNLTLMNVVEQRNFVGDQDQVHAARDAFVAETGAPVTVTTGSNALLNSATITEHGVDSVVMAGGDTYSDAMLYQAGLVDTDAAPTDIKLPELASEAVAFLVDDFVAPAPQDQMHGTSATHDWSTPVDVMQTMVT